MNQEEWLEYRRSLGLPADPAKDFPPGYRNDPSTPQGPDVVRNTTTSAHQRRKTESGQDQARQASRDAASAMAEALRRAQQSADTGPGPSYGSTSNGTSPTSPNRRSALGCLTGVALLAILIVIALSTVVPKVVDLFTSDAASTTNQHRDRGISSLDQQHREGQKDRERVLNASNRAMEFMARGDPSAIMSSDSSSVSLYDARLLTPMQARAAMGPNPTWKITDPDISISTATVNGTLTTKAGDIPIELRLVKTGNNWEVRGLNLPVLRTPNEDLPNGTKINGETLKMEDRPGTQDLLVWPGTLKVELPQDQFTTYSQPVLKQKLVSKLSSMASPESIAVKVEPKRTAAFNEQAKAAAAANLKKCLSSTSLDPKGCPFGGSVSNSVSKIRNVHFTQTVPVKKWEITGSYGDERIWGTGGEVTVSATGWKTTGNGRGYNTNIRGSWDTFVGEVSVKDSKVVFTAK